MDERGSSDFYVLRGRTTFFCHMAVGELLLGLGRRLGGGVKWGPIWSDIAKAGEEVEGRLGLAYSVCEET
jgi:hypothetical protein